MKRINIPLVADSIFFGVATFLIAFTLTRFYTKSSTLALLIGILVALSLGILAYLYIRHRLRKRLGITSNEDNLRKLKNHLCLLNIQGLKSLLGGIYVPTNEGKKQENFYIFKFSPVQPDDLLGVFHSNRKDKVVFCNQLVDESKQALKALDIEYLEINEIYDLLKEKNSLPSEFLEIKPVHKSVIERVRSRFTRKLTLPLFFSGLSLIALSYFTYFPLYYIIVGGILLVLSQIAILIK